MLCRAGIKGTNRANGIPESIICIGIPWLDLGCVIALCLFLAMIRNSVGLGNAHQRIAAALQPPDPGTIVLE